eukprot:jgi/Tetstr1/442957/TSEL_031019.t1
MFGGMGMYGPGSGTFAQNYRCYPVSFIDKDHLEEGNKVILPPSALDRLASLHIDYPMLFKIENKKEKKTSHCGVLEFVADEGMVYMPYWMMQNLVISEGDVVNFKSATLPKGSYVKLQPHTKDFLDISNPKAVLERTLRNYSCLTKGDCILVHYNNKNYYIDIVESKPQDAISIVETDCEVDFAPPLDYEEPAPLPPRPPVPAPSLGAPTGKGAAEAGAAEAEAPVEPDFLAFAGSGRRLDGKSAGPSAPVPLARVGSGTGSGLVPLHRSASGTSVASSSGEGGEGAARPGSGKAPVAGKVVFGAGPAGRPRPTLGAPKAKKKEEEKKPEEGKEEPSFAAFSGKGYKLA